jgi:hypothetical protein
MHFISLGSDNFSAFSFLKKYKIIKKASQINLDYFEGLLTYFKH